MRLVCVPGLGLEAGEWRAVATRVLEGPGVEGASATPLPGYGRPARRGDDLGPAALAERLAGRLGPSTVLAGHSASCQVVARAAALVPDRVRALVLVGPTTDPRAASWGRLAERWVRTAGHEPPWQVPLLARSYTRTGLGSMGRAMEAARHDDIRDTLRAVRCPVLVIRGRDDRICPEDWTRDLACIPSAGGRAVTLAAGGHMVPLTHAPMVASAVSSMLQESAVGAAR